MTALLLTVRFLLELALLAAWAVVGWNAVDPTWLQVALAVLLPAASAATWGLFIAPRARFSIALGVRLVIELALFAGASVGLWLSDFPLAAVLLIGLEVVVLMSLLAVGQRPGPGDAAESPAH